MESDLAKQMAELARDMDAGRLGPATADAIAARAVGLVDGADWVSITVRKRGRYQTLASSHDRATSADRLQYESGEGPCVDVADNGDWLRSGDVGTDRRWPRWGPAAADVGVGSLLSISLVTGADRIGALNIYAERTGAFHSRDTIDHALLFGVHAALAVSAARQLAGLETALGSRHVIGVAQGVLIERYGLTLDQSFALLSRISSHTNTKIATLCALIVETGELPDGMLPQAVPGTPVDSLRRVKT